MSRLERARKLIYGRLWGSNNWRPRGGELDYEIVIAMCAAMNGLRFKRFIVPRETVVRAHEMLNVTPSGNEGMSHAQMKAVALRLLRDWGHGDASREYPMAGGRVDVASERGKVYVECGDTDPLKIIEITSIEGATGILVPYCRKNEYALFEPYRDMQFYRFAMTDTAKKALNETYKKQQEKMFSRFGGRNEPHS